MVIKRNLLIHLIDSLSIGGAEILLKNSIQLLSEYRHLVVYLNAPETLKNQFPPTTEFICLEHKGWGQTIQTVQKLRRIIKEKKPVLVHAHLLQSTVIARLAVPSSTPLASTIHSLYSQDAFTINKKGLWAERLTIKRQDALIAVSEYILEDYLKWVPFKRSSFVLHNFLPSSFFKERPVRPETGTLKCIAVGTLKEAKNYPYLLKIFRFLKDKPITLDIYGTGGLKKELEKEITIGQLKVSLKGHASDIQHLLPQYDLFIQASAHEGFGLSVIEAVAAKVPIFISRIPVFEEITSNNAHFFSLDNAEEASAALLKLSSDKDALHFYTDSAYAFAQEKFSEKVFLSKLQSIYQSLICQNKE